MMLKNVKIFIFILFCARKPRESVVETCGLCTQYILLKPNQYREIGDFQGDSYGH